MKTKKIVQNILGTQIYDDHKSKNYEGYDYLVECEGCGSRFYKNAVERKFGKEVCPNKDCKYPGSKLKRVY